MPVSSHHPEYDRQMTGDKIWKKCRDAVEGEEAVKAGAEDYLPRLDQQQDPDYKAYRMRALFYGAAHRTVQGLVGAVMKKAPTVKFPDSQKDILLDVGTNGESLEQIVKAALNEGVTMGRVGILVDIAEGEQTNPEPYMTIYRAEDIINWREEVKNGRKQLVNVVLEECSLVPRDDDPFSYVKKTCWRELTLEGDIDNEAAEDADAVYTVNIWEKKEVVETNGGTGQPAKSAEDEYEIVNTITPKLKGGKTLNFIPFRIVGAEGVSAQVDKPPILDLVNVNLSHYRTSADLEHGRHFTALPTAYAFGFDTKGAKVKVGSAVAWMSENPDAKCGFLEFSGAGLGSLADALKQKEQLMAVLGARLLEEQKADSEAAETVRLRHAGEQSVLANIADAVSEGIEDALAWMLMWTGVAGEDVQFALSTEYDIAGVDAPTLAQLSSDVDNNKLSWTSYFYVLQRGGFVPDGTTKEDEESLIKAGTPVPRPVLPLPSPAGGIVKG